MPCDNSSEFYVWIVLEEPQMMEVFTQEDSTPLIKGKNLQALFQNKSTNCTRKSSLYNQLLLFSPV